MTSPNVGVPWPALQRARRTVVMVDMVESVRLIEAHEEDTVRRWQQFVGEVSTQLLPAHRGRLVKSLGDGLLCEFEDARPAVASAVQMQQAAHRLNDGYPAEQAIRLRIGAHTANLIVDERDVYGVGVNLAARLAQLAGPGEIVVSPEVRDSLVDGLDVTIADLGDCYVKHVQEPVHAFRIGDVGADPIIASLPERDQSRPVVAVVPFSARAKEPTLAMIGELLADEVIGGLSQSSSLNVISRLSTSAFRDRDVALPDIGSKLGARYILSGAYHAIGDKVRLSIELSDVQSHVALCALTLSAPLGSVLTGDDDMIPEIVARVGSAVAERELQRAATAPLPSLESCTLLMGATALMHRATAREFDRARELLDHLAERHRRRPQAHAWLGKWHVLRVVQGWTENKLRETQLAQASVQRALDADPSCALALAIGGLVHAYLRKDLGEADRHYHAALDANPNESLAWLFTSTLHSYRGEGGLASAAAERALRLSPLDPLKYFFYSLAATAVLSEGRYARAIELAQQSMRLNRTHTSTYRALAIAQVLNGDLDAARETVLALRQLEPELTVQGFADRYPGQVPGQTRQYAEALRVAGLPAR